MKILNHNEKHELGNGWGFYIDTDMDSDDVNKCDIHIRYNEYEYNDTHDLQCNKIHNIININNVKYDINNDMDFVNMEVVSIISLTLTCLFAFFIH